MLKSAREVIRENITNLYRTFSIARYDLLSEMRDSKLGIFWNFASPAINVFTYWFLFGYVMQRRAVGDIPYIIWMLAGTVIWFFASQCITDGCNAIYYKSDIISKMKFPISILPLTLVLKKLFNHFCLMCIVLIVFISQGYYPTIHWLGLIYYLLCAIIFAVSLSLTTSVLNMIARDTRKLISSCMRLIFYFTPILWDAKILPEWMQYIVKCNPIYYLVQGYRDCFFYHRGVNAYTWSMAWFWGITLVLFFLGSYLMCRFKTKFVDMI